MRTQPVTITQPILSFKDHGAWLTYADLKIPDLIHGIAVFKGSELGLDRNGWVRAISTTVEDLVGVAPSRIVIPVQTHGRTVRSIPPDSSDDSGGPCDGLVTTAADTMIGITVADCVPLFAVNPGNHVAGLAHCGWRGIAAGIVEAFHTRLKIAATCTQGTRYVIGASIGQCCYEVGGDLLERFPAQEVRGNAVSREGKVFFDLKAVVASRLMGMGVGPGQISIDKTCTACQKYILSSFRASGTESGRMLAIVMFTR